MNPKIRYRRGVVALVLGLSTVAVGPRPALAAAPGNDTISGATPAAIGYSDAGLDTTEATTDADDAQLNTSCGAPATDASVWYTLTGSDTGVVADVSQSNYSAGITVATGTQGNLQTVICGPGTVAFFAAAGTTYYVLAFDFQGDGGGNGGRLTISFNEAPPPPTVDFTVNPSGQVNARTGVATLSGTYACTNGDFIDVFGDARQSVGRFIISGSFEFFEPGRCDGASHPWSAHVVPQNGKFAGGKAMTVTFAVACGPFQCSEGFVEQTVQLRSGRK